MMQLDALVVYNSEGEKREIRFRPGRLNIITGESATGKSSMIGILRFLLGGDSPNVPRGPIQNTVAWYGLLAHVEDTSFFIGRPAPPRGSKTEMVMLSIGVSDVPEFSSLETNGNTKDLVDYLGGLIGIEENLHVPSEGQTRRPLTANFRHSLYYNFQGQGEVANPDLLFHRQNREFQKQTIRDTFPYFLGAQGSDALRKRQELTDLRRKVRRQSILLEEAQSLRQHGLGRAAGLIADAKASGLLTADVSAIDAGHAFELLRGVLELDAEAASVDSIDSDEITESVLDRRAELREDLRTINAQIRSLDEFARIGTEYGAELNEHRVRLASVGLIPSETTDSALCPICQGSLTSASSKEAIDQTLGRVARRIEMTIRDQPRISAANADLIQRRNQTRDELSDIDSTLEDLARTDDLRAAAQRKWDEQSFVRGRIAQYLDTTLLQSDDEIAQLERSIGVLEEEVAVLADELDPEALRSTVDSLLGIVSRRLTALAQSLPLEHSEYSVRIDPYRLTVVADTLEGPAYMDEGEIGSGMSWVGYHLTSYLALQDYFIEANRPVSRFVVFDQPSQAFFPRERETGGDLEELTDTDRDNTRKLYKLMYDRVIAHNGQLQIIAFDHADFSEPWFKQSIVDKPWRDGTALIPQDWFA